MGYNINWNQCRWILPLNSVQIEDSMISEAFFFCFITVMILANIYSWFPVVQCHRVSAFMWDRYVGCWLVLSGTEYLTSLTTGSHLSNGFDIHVYLSRTQLIIWFNRSAILRVRLGSSAYATVHRTAPHHRVTFELISRLHERLNLRAVSVFEFHGLTTARRDVISQLQSSVGWALIY